MRYERFLVPATIVAVALLAWFCASRERRGASAHDHGRSPEEEVALGREAIPELTRLAHGYDSDASAQRRLASLGARLVARSPAARTPQRFLFRLLADPGDATAFCLPGGPIFLTRALLDRLDGDAAVAAILAHEIAHVVSGHGAGRALDEPPAATAAEALRHRYSARDEIEADVLGVDILLDAGYDPRALHDVVARLGDTALLVAHPDAETRLPEIDAEIARRRGKG